MVLFSVFWRCSCGFALKQVIQLQKKDIITMISFYKDDISANVRIVFKCYKGLMAGVERHKALKDAMIHVKELYPDPYYWAGFIMMD